MACGRGGGGGSEEFRGVHCFFGSKKGALFTSRYSEEEGGGVQI